MRGKRPARRESRRPAAPAVRSAPCQQRTEEQHRSPQAAHQRGVRLVLDDLSTAHVECGRADALDLRAEIDEQLRHDLDIADARHVREHAFFRRQQAGREQRQRRVLVPFHMDTARQAVTAFNQQRGHRMASV